MKVLGALRYLSAALFFCAVFYATYHREPARAAYCSGNRIIYEGPNVGNWDTQEECSTYWTNLALNQANDDCHDLCGPGCVYDNQGSFQECCPATGGGYEWSNGVTPCLCWGR